MKSLKLVATLLSTTVLGCGLSTIGFDAVARAAADRLLGLHLASIRVDPTAARIVLTGLATGDNRVSIGRLSLPLLRVQSKDGAVGKGTDPAAPASGGSVRVPDASKTASPAAGGTIADDIVFIDGRTTFHIKHLEIAGSPLSAGDVATMFGGKDAKALEEQLHKLDAASIVIPEITGDDEATQTHFSQKQLLLADVHGGRATTGSAAVATFTTHGDQRTVKVTVGATTFRGLDLAQIAHLAAGPRTDDSEAQRSICDDLAMQAFTIQSSSIDAGAKDGQPLTIATISEKGLRGRPLSAEAFKLVNTKGTEAKDDEAEKKNNALVADDLSHSFSVDLVQADEFAIAGPLGEDAEGLKSFGLKHLALHDFAAGRLGEFELDRLVAEGNEKQPGKIALGTASMVNSGVVNGFPSVDKIDLRDIVIDIPVNEKSGPASHLAMTVTHAGYEAPGLVIGKLPQKANMSIEHAVFDVPPDSGAAPMLLAMGYKRLDLSSESVSRYDTAAQTLDLDRVSLSGVGMGTLDVKLGLANVSQSIVSQTDAVQKAAVAAILLKTFDLKLRNDGLIDKAIGFKAAIDGVTLEQERTNIVQLIDTGLVGLGLQGSTKAQNVVAALHKFIADPKTLHIALASKDGLGAGSLSMIDSPQTLLDAVDLQASADE